MSEAKKEEGSLGGLMGLLVLAAVGHFGHQAYVHYVADSAAEEASKTYDAQMNEEIGLGISLEIRMCLDGRADLLNDRAAADHVCCNPKGLSVPECTRAIAFMRRQHEKNQAMANQYK